MPLVVGIDLGTQSLKAVLCDADLRVLGDHAIAYPTQRPAGDRAEQDPRAWEAALAAAVAGAVGARGGEVVAIAIAGQLDGCIAVDARGEPLAPARIWQDRSAPLVDLDPARVFAITGQVADPSHLAPKAAALPGAARYHAPVSYLVARLTGEAVLDPALASTTMLLELATERWSAELLAAHGLTAAQLPRLAPTCSIAGALRAPLAGIAAGVASDGVTFIPALAGLMAPVWRPAARGTLHGLGAAHDRRHVARAVLEGLAFACRDVAERLAALGLAATEAVVLGGGARSAVWTQLRADALGLPHRVAARTDTCAIGAAMIAAVAAGLAPDLVAAAARAEPLGPPVVPHASLDEPYARYRALIAQLGY